MEFINAGLLGMAAFAAVPILIHLLHKPHPKVQPFPTVMFLKKCARRSRAFATLKNLLLMSLRAAAVVLIVFAVARPRMAGAAQVGDQGLAAAIVLDDSYRMGWREAGLSRFEEARKRALEILATMPSGTECSFGLASGESTPLSADLAAVRAELLRAAPGDLGVPLLPAVAEAGRSLEGAKDKKREVHVFTDGAKVAWTGASKEALKALNGVAVYVHDIGKPGINAAITKVELAPKAPRVGRPVEIVATVASWGGNGTLTVSLKLADGGAEEKVVSVPDGGTALVRFRTTPEKGPLFEGTLSLATPDALAADDVRHFAVPVNEPLNVLVVEALPDAERGIAPFLTFALAPPSLKDRRPAVVTSVSPAEVGRHEFRAFDAVLVTCPSELSREDLARLGGFVAGGRGLAVFAGVDMAPWVTAGLFPTGQAPSETSTRIAIGTADHPVFSVFRAGRNGDIAAPTFSRRWFLRRDARWRAAVLFDDGTPAALEAVAGRGRILAFPFALAGTWTDLPKFPCFVPFAHEVARHLAGVASAEREFAAGAPVFITLPKAPTDLDYALVDLRAATREKRRADPAQLALHVARSLAPGRYAIEMAGELRPFAVNLDATASDPTRIDREAYSKLLPGAKVSFEFERAAVPVIREARSGRELTLFALLGVVALLLVEIWLASRV